MILVLYNAIFFAKIIGGIFKISSIFNCLYKKYFVASFPKLEDLYLIYFFKHLSV